MLLLAAFSGTIYFFVAYHMGRPLDHELQQDLAVVRENLQIDAEGQVRWKGKTVQSRELWPSSNPWFELWDEKGQLVRRFWPFNDSRLERTPTAPAQGREPFPFSMWPRTFAFGYFQFRLRPRAEMPAGCCA
jgi:hypothetical protein